MITDAGRADQGARRPQRVAGSRPRPRPTRSSPPRTTPPYAAGSGRTRRPAGASPRTRLQAERDHPRPDPHPAAVLPRCHQPRRRRSRTEGGEREQQHGTGDDHAPQGVTHVSGPARRGIDPPPDPALPPCPRRARSPFRTEVTMHPALVPAALALALVSPGRRHRRRGRPRLPRQRHHVRRPRHRHLHPAEPRPPPTSPTPPSGSPRRRRSPTPRRCPTPACAPDRAPSPVAPAPCRPRPSATRSPSASGSRPPPPRSRSGSPPRGAAAPRPDPEDTTGARSWSWTRRHVPSEPATLGPVPKPPPPAGRPARRAEHRVPALHGLPTPCSTRPSPTTSACTDLQCLNLLTLEKAPSPRAASPNSPA